MTISSDWAGLLLREGGGEARDPVRGGDHDPLRARQPGSAGQVGETLLGLVLPLPVSPLSGRHGVRHLRLRHQVLPVQGGAHPGRELITATGLEVQVSLSSHGFFLLIMSFRFCNEPYDLDMIIEIIERVEKELEDISKNPSVKLYENFLRRHSPTLHIKHYLNLLGEVPRLGIKERILIFQLKSESLAYCLTRLRLYRLRRPTRK